MRCTVSRFTEGAVTLALTLIRKILKMICEKSAPAPLVHPESAAARRRERAVACGMFVN
jgi:hypothetical protein